MPKPVMTGEINHAIIVDGIKIGNVVCLIARTTDHVITWVWVPHESSKYWIQLFRLIPQPKYIACDDQKGLLKAILFCWAPTTIQRCRFYAWLNMKAKLTLNPKSKAGQNLFQLTKELKHSKTRRQARHWKRKLKKWYKKHYQYIN